MDAKDMRDTLRLWASGVAVVSTSDSSCRAGMTVSAFNSLSLDPPTILVCLQKDTRTAEVIQSSGIFAVSILGADQAYVSDRFAGRDIFGLMPRCDYFSDDDPMGIAVVDGVQLAVEPCNRIG